MPISAAPPAADLFCHAPLSPCPTALGLGRIKQPRQSKGERQISPGEGLCRQQRSEWTHLECEGSTENIRIAKPYPQSWPPYWPLPHLAALGGHRNIPASTALAGSAQ